MLTGERNVGTREVRIRSFRPVEHLASLGKYTIPMHSHRHAVLHLAGIHAGIAPDAAK